MGLYLGPYLSRLHLPPKFTPCAARLGFCPSHSCILGIKGLELFKGLELCTWLMASSLNPNNKRSLDPPFV